MTNIALAVLLAGLAAWGLYAGRRHPTPRWPWTLRQWLAVLTFVLLIGGATLCAVCLAAGVFRRWMLIPVGLAYLTMLPMRCYFPWVTATPRRWLVRNVFFVLIAVALVGLGLW